jgi:hypothetical protein
MKRHRWWIGMSTCAGVAALAVAGIATAGPAHPALSERLVSATTSHGPVSTKPAAGTPELTSSRAVEKVRQLVQCGGTMYAVGSFTQIRRYGTLYTRDNVFSFSATSPYKVTSWAPSVNGEVNSIAFSGSDCASAYIGGDFTSVNGTVVKNIAEVSTSTGAVATAFGHNADGKVETLAAYKSHLLVGGYYKSINGSSANPYMTSLNPATGKDDGFIHLSISGNYQFCGPSQCVSDNPTRVYNQQLSHGRTLDLVEGDFTSAGGVARQQIFMLNLATSPASVTGWTSPEWDGSDPSAPYQCYYTEAFYIRAASWSPNDSTVYLGTTGNHPYNLPTGTFPRSGLCDAAAAFPATQTSVHHTWINYTGCDSLYSTVAGSSAVFFGGHERWTGNPGGCDSAGPGAVSDTGMEGVSPASGSALLSSHGNALYHRSRGKGADDMLLTGAGLWVASDNFQNNESCEGVSAHAGICFLPFQAK